MSTREAAIPAVELLAVMKRVSLAVGMPLQRHSHLQPLSVELQFKDDPYSRGCMGVIGALADLLRQSPECREALADFFLEPVLQEVEGPGCGGRND